ncbi:MAG: hypothetical protein U0744_19100 [Gemmataceae bacterium]
MPASSSRKPSPAPGANPSSSAVPQLPSRCCWAWPTYGQEGPPPAPLKCWKRIETLKGDADQRVLTVAWFGGFLGFTVPDLVRGANVTPQEAEATVQKLRDEHKLATIAISGHRQVLLHAEVLSELDERILAAVGRLHAETPLMTAYDRPSRPGPSSTTSAMILQ